MAEIILSNQAFLINQQIKVQEELLGYHLKAEAMSEVLLSSNLKAHSTPVLHDYLWALNNFIVVAKEVNEQSLNFLMLLKSQLTNPDKGTIH